MTPRSPLSAVLLSVALFSASPVIMAACSGPQETEATVKEGGEIGLERIDDPEATAAAEYSPMVLVCGYNLELSEDIPLKTYYDTPEGLSLYQLPYYEDLFAVWAPRKGYDFRRPPGSSASAAIGRDFEEPCYGNGDEAKEIVRQVVLHRAGGRDSREALLNLLRQDRTTHFIIDRDGSVEQPLDVVHAAFGPTDNTNFGIYIALVAPRQPEEWLPEVLLPSMLSGLRGSVQAMAAQMEPLTPRSISAPSDAQVERTRCEVNGVEVAGDTYTAEQIHSLQVLIRALSTEYPELSADLPISPDGSVARAALEDAAFHRGILADYHTSPAITDMACLDLEAVAQGL